MTNIINSIALSTHEAAIAMPNEIFDIIREMWNAKTLKSKNHQEFVYSYYYLIAYLWRYSLYYPKGVPQSSIKEMLGYNAEEKRVNYIIKNNGLLDEEKLTMTTTNFPISWELCEGGVSFTHLMDYDDEARSTLKLHLPKNYIVKEPILHTGDHENEGIFHNAVNCHIIDSKIFALCMNKKDLGNSAFYMYGLLKYMQDKNLHFNDTGFFNCSNETLTELTSWSLKKVIEITNTLQDYSLISKEQRVKVKGNVNLFGVF